MISESLFSEFTASVQDHYSVPETSIRNMADKLRQISIPANAFLWKAGDQLTHISFLTSGLMYGYFETEEGKSFCKEVYWGRDLVFGFRSLVLQIPMPYYVKAIEPSELLQIHVEDYWSLLKTDEHWQAFHHACIEEYYMYKETKEEFLLLLTPEKRVQYFFDHYPDLVGRVPQHIVASYLGITPISFSRIKKRLHLP